jgi:hypothetical protein
VTAISYYYHHTIATTLGYGGNNTRPRLQRLLYQVSIAITLSNTYFTSVVQQPSGYNVTGQLQEPKDLIRPATAKIVFTTL